MTQPPAPGPTTAPVAAPSTVPTTVPTATPATGDPQTPGPAAASVSDAVPPLCPTRTRLYCDGQLMAEGFPAEQISERLAEHADTVVWLDLLEPTEADLAILTQEFGLHPLAVEDAVHDHQRPKLDVYPSHLFANMYAVTFDLDGGRLATSEISAFITPRALITVRKADFDVDALLLRWDATGAGAARRGPAAGGSIAGLVHGLLDAVVDGHLLALDALDDGVESLEDAVFEPSATTRRATDVRRRGFALRKALVRLRRVVVPMREVIARLMRLEQPVRLVDDGWEPYYQDVHDHVLRAAEGVESAGDLIDSVLETDMTEQSNQLNEITKKLAAWAAIIAVPTAVTGYYGQNVPYPGFGHHWGFVDSSVLIVLLAGGLYIGLRRRGWL